MKYDKYKSMLESIDGDISSLSELSKKDPWNIELRDIISSLKYTKSQLSSEIGIDYSLYKSTKGIMEKISKSLTDLGKKI